MRDDEQDGEGSRWPHVALFVALAAPLAFLWTELHFAASFVLLVPFLAHAIARAGGLERARRLLSLASLGLASIVGGITAATATAMTLVPAQTSDGHPVMPIGQAIAGAVFGIGGGALLSSLYVKRTPAGDRGMDTALHGVGALLAAIAVYRLAD